MKNSVKTKAKREETKALCKEILDLLHKSLLAQIKENIIIKYNEDECPYYLILKMKEDINIGVLVMDIDP